jgi:ATP-dependent RNA helicase RhlB
MTFDEYDFHDKLKAGIRDLGFVEPTPVQAETFQLIAQGKDIEAQSQTGTGKTAAFLISGFQLMMSDVKFQGRKMLVIAPTRELADQIEKEAKAIGKHLNFRIGAFYGGVGYAPQEKLIAEGVDVIIGTPGRLLDFVGQGKLDFKDVGVLVIDEADRLFDMGFYPDLRQMLRTMSNPEDRRTMLFSATLSSQVMNLAWEYLREPGQIVIEPEHVTVEKITQELFHVSSEEKFGLLLSVMKKEQPKTSIIFCNTKHTAVRVAKRLELNGFETEFIMGDMPQSKRLKIIEDMKAGKTPVLVATDVAARGLHINGLDLVVNYDLPTEAENYVHRIGRTARAGHTGKAVSLACEKYVYGLKAIEEYTGVKIPVLWADEKDQVEDKSRGVYIAVDEEFEGSRGRDRDRDRGRGGRDRGRPQGREGARPQNRDGRAPAPREGGREGAPRDDSRRGGRGRDRDRDKPMVIRSSSLVNEATGVKFLKDGMDSDAQKKRSSQGDKIAAAAAAVGTGGRRRGRKGEQGHNPKQNQKPAPQQNANAKPGRNDQKPSGAPRHPQHTQGQHRQNQGQNQGRRDQRPARPKDPALKDRLDYYKSKYGEEFKPVQESKPQSGGFFGKIAGLFGLGKKKK